MKYPITFLRDSATDDLSGGGGGVTEPQAPAGNPFASTFSGGTAPTVKPAESTPAPVETPAATQSTQQAATVAPVAPVAQPTSQVIGLTPEQLRTLTDAVRTPAATPVAEPAMSEADFKQAFNIVEATPEMYEQILGVKPTSMAQVQALNGALQGISKQSVTITRYLMEQKVRELQADFNSRLAPVQSNYQAQTEQKYFNEFTGTYPGLKDYQPLLKEIVEAARGRGEKFNSAQEAMTFVAEKASKLLGKPLESLRAPAQGGSSSSTQATTQQPGARQMSTMSMGGRSGSSGGATPAKSTAERIFHMEN